MSEISIAPQATLAVFADIENVCGSCDQLGVVPDLTPIVVHLAGLAKPIIRRSCGDIAMLPHQFSKHNIRRMLQKNLFTHEDVPQLPGMKNSADIRLIIAAVALAHQRPDITHFAILSADRDFAPLVTHLRELGRTVIGVGPSPELVNDDYSSAFDSFLFYADIAGMSAQPLVGQSNMTEMVAGIDGAAGVPDSPQAETPSNEISAVGRLLAVIEALQASNQACIAPVMAAKMMAMFPDFDFKGIFGSFKQYCLTQAKTGRIRLRDIDQSDFSAQVVKTAKTSFATSIAIVPPAVSGQSQATADEYRLWGQAKLKMDMPTRKQRHQLYEALAQIMGDRTDNAPIPLKTLAKMAGERLPGMADMAFRVFYGLFRSRAFRCEIIPTEAYNPGVVKIIIPVEQLDHNFIVNTLTAFRNDNTDLPFDATAWSLLLYGDTSAAWEINAIDKLPDMRDCAHPAARVSPYAEIAA